LDLPKGWVPATQFWLIDKNEYIGNVIIRHQLNDTLMHIGGHIGYSIRPTKRKMGYGTSILKLSLSEARKLGIDKALVTCDETNLGSKKIIEKNGGILENIEEGIKGKPRKLRYWIAIS
jgi:predicted acetyltransferase